MLELPNPKGLKYLEYLYVSHYSHTVASMLI